MQFLSRTRDVGRAGQRRQGASGAAAGRRVPPAGTARARWARHKSAARRRARRTAARPNPAPMLRRVPATLCAGRNAHRLRGRVPRSGRGPPRGSGARRGVTAAAAMSGHLHALGLTSMGAAGTALGGALVCLQPKMDFKRLGVLQVGAREPCDAAGGRAARLGGRGARAQRPRRRRSTPAAAAPARRPRAAPTRRARPALPAPRASQPASCSASPSWSCCLTRSRR
jgi:hypothetical protein